MMRKGLRRPGGRYDFVAIIMAGFVVACTGGNGPSGSTQPPPPAAVATINIAPDTRDLLIGDTVQYTATTKAADGAVLTGRVVQWASSASSVAVVSTEGTVTAVAEGRTTITATSEGVSASALVRVVPAADVLAGDPASPAVAAIPLLATPPVNPADFQKGSPAQPNAEVSIRDALLRISPDATLGQLNAVLQMVHAKVVAGSPGVPGEVPGLIVVRLPTGSHDEMAAVLETLRAQPIVMQAQPDLRIGMHIVTPVRTLQSLYQWTWELRPDTANWGLEAVRAPALWNLNDAVRRSGNRTLTAVFDLGFYPSEDLVYEQQFAESYQHTHGVHVAGILAATFGNGTGIDGVNPFARLVSAGGFETVSSLMTDFRAFLEAVPEEIRVVNISLGYNTGANGDNTTTDAQLQRRADDDGNHVIDTLRAIGERRALPVIVVSGGNDSDSFPDQQVRYASPYANAAMRGVAPIIVVESLENNFSTGNQSRSGFSNIGGHVSAPGSAILSTTGATDYDRRNGTSQAAPHVAGVVSYLYALAPTLPAPTMTSNAVRDLIIRSAREMTAPLAPMLDAFGAALEVDRELGNDHVLRALVDIDDGTLDGNTRLGTGEHTDDFDGNGGIGDGAVDMSDFRRWRDWYLQVQDDSSLALNGPATHRKRDLNGDGVVAAPASENVHPRGDFNGDGRIDRHATMTMAGVLSGPARTDLDVLRSRFSDPYYHETYLPSLLESADFTVDARGCLLTPGVDAVLVEIQEIRNPDVTIRARIVQPGADGPEMFTEAVVVGGHRVIVSALNENFAKEGPVESRDFVLSPGEDASFAATCGIGTLRHSVSVNVAQDPNCTVEQFNVSDQAVGLSAPVQCEHGGVEWASLAENESVLGRGRLMGVITRTGAPEFSMQSVAYGGQEVNDIVTINAPGLAGQQGSVTVAMEISGNLAAIGSCASGDTPTARFALTGTVLIEGSGQIMFPNLVYARSPCAMVPDIEFPTTASGSFNFTYGVPFRLAYSIHASARNPAGFYGSLTEAFAEMEFRWLGMTGLPEGATITSSFGVNWRDPIP